MAVVKAFNILEDAALGLVSGPKSAMVKPFLLERVEETLGHGIVVAVALAAHRTDHPVVGQVCLEGFRSILDALIRVKQKPSMGLPLLDGRLQGLANQI